MRSRSSVTAISTHTRSSKFSGSGPHLTSKTVTETAIQAPHNFVSQSISEQHTLHISGKNINWKVIHLATFPLSI
jgi:hypothetical protein